MKILKILSIMTMAVLAGTALGAATNINPLPFIGGLFILSLIIPRPGGVLSVSLLDLVRPTGDNPGGGGGIDSEIILINADDIDMANFPARSTLGGKITGNIPMKAGKYMHRFYATDKTIKPSQKKLKGSNVDCGGYEVGVETFHPGLEEAILNWIDSFGFSFRGFVILQNCTGSKKYLLGEPCNLINVDDLESMWGSAVNEDKGTKVIFKGQQSRPIALYEGGIYYDPGSASW
jgi:hypothetical protein